MKTRRRALVRLALCALLALVLAPALVHAAGSAPPHLGTLTVQPPRVRIGSAVTVSGRTAGEVLMFPPVVLLQSVRVHIVTMPPGPCGGGNLMPLASHQVTLGAATPAGRRTLPAGVSWQIRFRVPRMMGSATAKGASTRIATPPGQYRIVVIGAGMGGPCGPVVQSSAFISVAKLTITR